MKHEITALAMDVRINAMDVDPRPEEENFFMYEILDDVLETAAYRE